MATANGMEIILIIIMAGDPVEIKKTKRMHYKFMGGELLLLFCCIETESFHRTHKTKYRSKIHLVEKKT